MKRFFLFKILLLLFIVSRAQFVVKKGGEVHLDENAQLFVEGNIESDEPITDNGVLSLCGTTAQRINLRGYAVPNIHINNSGGSVELDGDLLVSHSLFLENGILTCGEFDLFLGPEASSNSAGENSWIATNRTGKVHKKLGSALSNYLIPLGGEQGYTPVYLSSGNGSPNSSITISSASGVIGTKPAGVEDYLDISWKVGLSGVKEVKVLTRYSDKLAIKGEESAIQAFYHAFSYREKINADLDRAGNVITATVSGEGGDIFAIRPPAGIYRSGLWPNPASSYSNLAFYSPVDGRKEILITDAAGRIVRRQLIGVSKGFNQYRINTSALANGNYQVRASGLDQSFPLLKK